MAVRVTATEVLEIMAGDTELNEVTITPYINSASVFVDALLVGKLRPSLLVEIEKWLAAHMASVARERLIKQAGAGGAEVRYAGEWTQELSSTQFGQMVLMLDTSNTLRNLQDGVRQAWTFAVPEE